MNKQELLEKWSSKTRAPEPILIRKSFNYVDPVLGIYEQGFLDARTEILRDLEQLDEPQRPVVPKVVGEYLNYCMANEWTLREAFLTGKFQLPEYLHEAVDWLEESMNQNIFTQAWLFGYEIKEPLYCVKIGKGYFSGWDETKVTYVIDDAPDALAQCVKYETREEAEIDAIEVGGTVEEVAEG